MYIDGVKYHISSYWRRPCLEDALEYKTPQNTKKFNRRRPWIKDTASYIKKFSFFFSLFQISRVPLCYDVLRRRKTFPMCSSTTTVAATI